MRMDLENRNKQFGGSLTLQSLPEEIDRQESTTHGEYLDWNAPKPPLSRPQSNLKPEGDIQFQSVSQSDYATDKARLDGELRSEIAIPPESSWKLQGGVEFETTAGAEFTPKEAERVSPTRQRSALRDLNRTVVVHPYISDGKFSDETTSKEAYQQYQGVRPEVNIAKETLRNEGSIDFTTTVNNSFQGEHGERASLLRPKTSLHMTGKTDLTTVNNEAYKAMAFVPEKPKSYRPADIDHTTDAPFLETTTLRSDFPNWNLEKPNREKPQDNLKPEGSHNLVSTTKSDYAKRTGLNSVERPFPVDNLKPEGLMEFNPVTASEYVSKSFAGSTIKIPSESRNASHWKEAEGPTTSMNDISVSKLEYQHKGVKRPTSVRPKPNLKIEGEMELHSTTNTEYISKYKERTPMLRPSTSMKFQGHIDFQTTNKQHYTKAALVEHKGCGGDLETGPPPNSLVNTHMKVSEDDVPRPNLKTQIPKLKPENKTDYTTTNQNAFPSKKATEKPIKTQAPADKIYEYMDHQELAEWPRNKIKDRNTDKVREPPGTERNAMISTSHSDYSSKPLQQNAHDETRASDMKSMRELFLSKLKKESSNTYEYLHGAGITTKPKTSLKMEGEHDFLTTTQSDFFAKELNKTSSLRPKSSVNLDEGQRNADNVSLTKASFQGLKAEKAKVSPRRTALKMEGDFTGETTLGKDYQRWECVPRTKATKPPTTLKLEGRMNMDSTTKVDFEGRFGVKNKICRPKSSLRHTGKHDLKTTNQEAYGQVVCKEERRRKPKAVDGEPEQRILRPVKEIFTNDRYRNIPRKPIPAERKTEPIPEVKVPVMSERIPISNDYKVVESIVVPKEIEHNLIRKEAILPERPIAALYPTGLEVAPPFKETNKKKSIQPATKPDDKHGTTPAHLVLSPQKISPDLLRNIPEIRVPVDTLVQDFKKATRVDSKISTHIPAAIPPTIEIGITNETQPLGGKHRKGTDKEKVFDRVTQKHRNNRYKCSLQPTGQMDFTTTTGSSFLSKDLRRSKSDSSVYGASTVAPGLWASKKHSLTSQGSLKQHLSNIKLSGGIDFTTTNRQSYRPSSKTTVYSNVNTHQARMNRPKSNGIFRAQEPFYDNTTYKQHYGPDHSSHNGRKCPAERLNSQSSRFAFKEEVNGHKFYMPSVQS